MSEPRGSASDQAARAARPPVPYLGSGCAGLSDQHGRVWAGRHAQRLHYQGLSLSPGRLQPHHERGTDVTYRALDIAKWFIAWADDEDADLSNLKLQKLLYYAQGWHIALTGRQLFTEDLQAWSHGPVVPQVYRAFRDFGTADIRLANIGVADSDEFSWDQIEPETGEFLVRVWNTYGGYGAWALRNMTHDEAPWRDHFHADERNVVIPSEDLAKYFTARVPSV